MDEKRIKEAAFIRISQYLDRAREECEKYKGLNDMFCKAG